MDRLNKLDSPVQHGGHLTELVTNLVRWHVLNARPFLLLLILLGNSKRRTVDQGPGGMVYTYL